MEINIAFAVILLAVAVYLGTVVKLQMSKNASQDPIKKLIINIAYISYVFIMMVVIFSKFNLQPSSNGLFATFLIIFGIAIFQSTIEDIVAFTIVGISNIYNIGHLIRVGSYLGQITDMGMFGATLENHFTKTKMIIPHGVIYSTFETL